MVRSSQLSEYVTVCASAVLLMGRVPALGARHRSCLFTGTGETLWLRCVTRFLSDPLGGEGSYILIKYHLLRIFRFVFGKHGHAFCDRRHERRNLLTGNCTAQLVHWHGFSP
ncbi:hypothetical protein L210DRAFT_3555926 [Boletus edulis BED1]|uniref:Uncharacterized protein n=1 Tax=Boletus edulis BED1 TaxID=1328754 RepID=A0AAD4BKM9_BOLED|nr:hypothetical protein L210DRAFT_3555926 [Boletus edulis BED1]